jgi:hypothetical protein
MRSNPMFVKMLMIHGTEVAISITVDGYFSAKLNGEYLNSDTIRGLEKKLLLTAKVSTANLNVEFTQIKFYGVYEDSEMEVTHGAAVGIHGGNKNLLVRWAGATDTVQIRGLRSLYRFSPNDIAKLKKLHAAHVKTQKAMHQFMESHEIDLKKEIQDKPDAKA